jgi:hypothetical protein
MQVLYHVSEREESCFRVLVGKYEGKRPLGKPSVDWRILLKLVFKK